MKRIFFLVALVILLAGVQLTAPVAVSAQSTWCSTIVFDYVTYQPGFTLNQGNIVGSALFAAGDSFNPDVLEFVWQFRDGYGNPVEVSPVHFRFNFYNNWPVGSGTSLIDYNLDFGNIASAHIDAPSTDSSFTIDTDWAFTSDTLHFTMEVGPNSGPVVGLESVEVSGIGDNPLAAYGFAPCTPQGPVATPTLPPLTGWCYNLDFKTSNPFTATYGQWFNGVGYVTDPDYHLYLTYNGANPADVYKAVMGFDRLDPGYANVGVDGILLNLTRQTFTFNIPAALTHWDYVFNADNASASFQHVSLAISGTATIAVTNLTLYGWNGNPFGASNCAGYEPTPTTVPPPTATPFPTVAPTATATPITPTATSSATITPTPTETIVPNWCYNFDFTVDNGGWLVAQGGYYSNAWNATYNPIGAGRYHVLNISKSFSASIITSVRIDYLWTSGTNTLTGETSVGIFLNHPTGPSVSWYVPTNPGSPVAWSGSTTADAILIQLMPGSNDSGDDPGGSAALTSVKVQGTGISPFGDNCSPTATPTPTTANTDTPAPTSTNAPTSTRTPLPTWTIAPPLFTPTPSPLPTRTPIVVVVPPSNTPRPTATRTPQAATATSQSNLTATAWVAGTGTKGAQNATGTALVHATQTAYPLTVTANHNATGTATIIATGTPGLPSTLEWNMTPINAGTQSPASSGNNTDVDVGQLGGSLIATIGNLFNSAMSWLGSLGRAGAIFYAWNNTAAVAPPGLPLCVTAPQSSELCAIWYILQYTVLAGPVGSLLIPAATAVVNMFCILSFIRFARALLARVMKVFS